MWADTEKFPDIEDILKKLYKEKYQAPPTGGEFNGKELRIEKLKES